MKKAPLEKAFLTLEPGPVVMISTFHKGRANLMTLSWHMVMDFTPRLGILTGPWNFSYEALLKTKECVVSIPGADLMEKVLKVGNHSGSDVEDKFEAYGLTPLKGGAVRAPLVKECLANIECRIVDHIKKHDIFVMEGISFWKNPRPKDKRLFHAVGNGTFTLDGKTLNRKKQMFKFPEATAL